MIFIKEYFPNLTKSQISKFEKLENLYKEWNNKINVISRKDIDNLYLHHILHSLAIAKIISFKNNTKILDVGTGGGFPGVPLAILFPNVKFHLIDSIGKKITVVNGVAEALNLTNIKGEHIRVENIKNKYDFIISRAVTRFDKFRAITKKNISLKNKNELLNGIIYLKGGDFSNEISGVENKIKIYNISDIFKEPFFETKKIIHMTL